MKILTLLFCLLAFSISVPAQNETVICPTISVSGPEMSASPGELVTFTANVENAEKYNIKYEWSVDVGEIIEGQGTPILTVRTSADTTRATVVITGLPEMCDNTASDTSIQYCSIPPVMLDEYSIGNNQIDKEKLDFFSNRNTKRSEFDRINCRDVQEKHGRKIYRTEKIRNAELLAGKIIIQSQ